MSSITTRATSGSGATVKGSPLTNAEIDNNFISLNADKLEASNINNNSIAGSLTSLGVGTSASGAAGEIRAAGTITSYYSDERLKENIEPIQNALNKLLTITGVTYNANQLAESFGFKDKQKQVGVLAGDVKKVLPEAVKPAPFDTIRINENSEISRSGENYQTVQYEKLVPLLIEAIRDLNNKIKKLEECNNAN
jgi:hypothetical protein